MSKHSSHVTRFSFDASTWDEMCINCGYTDMVPGGWGQLAYECPVPIEQRITIEEYYRRQNRVDKKEV